MQRKKESEDAKKRKREREEMDEEPPFLEVVEREEEAAKRQTFDPMSRSYDDRKRRVIDLAECTRITLSKTLPVEEEASIEMRRKAHSRAFVFHRAKYTENGQQESNLDDEQKRRLKSILRRVWQRRL